MLPHVNILHFNLVIPCKNSS